ncbi:unnamed protein product [Scytosiphon promiscuus]
MLRRRVLRPMRGWSVSLREKQWQQWEGWEEDTQSGGSCAGENCCSGGGGATLVSPRSRLATSGGALSDVGFKASPSPEGRVAAAMSLARSGGNLGDLGPAILTALRETAAAGTGLVGDEEERVRRRKQRSRERQQRV